MISKASLAIAAMFVATAPLHVVAQNDYPSRPIRIIVPVVPGAAADILPRIIAEKLTARFGQPVIVENRPGAN